MLERYAWGHGSETRDQAKGSPGKCSGEVGFSSVGPGPKARGGWPKGDGPRPMGRILCAMASSGPRFACAIMCTMFALSCISGTRHRGLMDTWSPEGAEVDYLVGNFDGRLIGRHIG